MPQIAIYLDDETARRLDDAAGREGLSRSAWTRRAIHLALGAEDQPYELGQESASSELREPVSASAFGPLPRSVVHRQTRLEAMRQGRSVQEVVTEALTRYFEERGLPIDEDPVAASWATLAAPRALVESILDEDSLLES